MSRFTSIVPFLGILAIFFITVKPAVALTAYECGDKVEKLTSVSLIDPNTDKCDREAENLKSSFEDFAVLQLNNLTYLTLPSEDCYKKSYSKLFIGKGTRSESRGMINIFNVDRISYSFEINESEISCGTEFWKTEVPGLFIVESKYLGNLEVSDANKDSDALNVFQDAKTQGSSPGNIQAKMELMYLNIKKHDCELQKEILKNKLALASTNPEEFAFQLMGGPGYTGIVAGEVVHVLKCGPVEFQVRETNKCYDRLPIQIEGKELFMKPRSHIITDHAAELPCNPILLEHYNVEGIWYQFSPEPVQAPPPLKLKLGSEMEWTQNIVSLVNSGIYRKEDVDQIKNRVMLP